MACLRSPWRLLSILCVLALFLPASPALPAGPSASASPAAPELPLAAPAELELGAPALSPPPTGTLYTVSDNPQRSAAATAGATDSPVAQSDDGTERVPEEIAGVPGVTSDWWAGVQEQIRQDMYTLFPDLGQDGTPTHSGHNLAHALDLTFAGGGVGLAPATPDPEGEERPDPAGAEAVAENGTDPGPPWTWNLTFTGFGYEGDLQPVSDPVEPVASDNRIEYRREAITEWYVNDDRGLEQGFTIASPPGTPSSGPLLLEMILSTDLVPTLIEGDQSIDFAAPDGNVVLLRYSDLHVEDAAGQLLAAHLQIAPAGEESGSAQHAQATGAADSTLYELRISIDAAYATYPLTIDPLISAPAWTALGENVGDSFGKAVATAGDVNGDGFADVVIGAHSFAGSEGKVYVYNGSAAGLGASSAWSRNGATGDRFGIAVGTAGDVNGDGYDEVIIGAYSRTSRTGYVSVYFGSASGLGTSLWQELGGWEDEYGTVVGTAGDVNGDGFDDVLAGAPTWDTNASSDPLENRGRVYVYYGRAAGLPSAADWAPTGENPGDLFGQDAGTAGDVNGDGYDDVVVGAPLFNGLQGDNSGRVYFYHGSQGGLAPGPASYIEGENKDDSFGESLGTAGDVNGDGFDDVIVGALAYDDGLNSNAGKAYVYHGTQLGMDSNPEWTVVGTDNDTLGSRVAGAGDVNGDGYDDVVVGTWPGDVALKLSVYHGSQDGLDITPAWTAASQDPDDWYGISLGTAGDVNGDGYGDLVIGASGHDSGRGKAEVHFGSATGLAAAPAWVAAGESASGYFGWSVATAGDVDSDGFSDLLVGAYGDSSSAGKVYLYRGSLAGLGSSPAWTAVGEKTGDRLGYSVSAAGDVDGDGFDDVLIGAPGHNKAAGAAYLFPGSPVGLLPAPTWAVAGENSGDELGSALAAIGDVDGDGYHDVAVGAYGYPRGSDSGKAYVYHGSETGPSSAPAWTASGERTGDHFAWSLGTAGDVNADGYADLAVGAYGHDGFTGRVYVYHGGSTSPAGALGLSASPDETLWGAGAGDSFGYAVGTAGDVTGDGYADLIVGASGHNSDQGRAWVFHGGASGIGSFAWVTDGENAGDRFGSTVGLAGDVNGDGYADVIVGAESLGSSQGKAYLFYGLETGLAGTATWSARGVRAGDRFSHAAATAGDVNGDGFADIVAGAWGFDEPSAANAGRVYAYHGAAAGLDTSATWAHKGDSAGDYFGSSVATAGDLNGDGYSDVVVGAPGFSLEKGKVYAFYGGSTGLTSGPADWTASGETAGDQFGRSVGAAGDVNGDGYADLIVGAFHHNGVVGKAYVYHGSPTGLTSDPADWTASGETAGDWYGWSVGTAGDVNGDGYADVVVGAYHHDSSTGRAYVYHGGPGGLTTGPADWTATGEGINNYFGGSVGTAGDVNGDGYADLVISAIHFFAFMGKAYVYHGGPSGLTVGPADWTATGENIGDNFGKAVSTAGDVNGDGYSDLVIGAYRQKDHGGNETGKAFVYHGGARGLDAPFSQLEGDNNVRWFGYSLGAAGDVNGDGYADLVVGAPGSATVAGRAFVYHGSEEGLVPAPVWTSSGEQTGDYFGWSVATAGDLNGDGFADLVVGALAFDGDWGKAYVYRVGGRQVAARQARDDGSGTPVQPWGVSHSEGGFQVLMQAPHPLGRGRVRMQVQACPPGVPFGDGACIDETTEVWREATGPLGTALNTTLAGLERGTLYRWRARAVYDSPLAIHGPWRRLQGQAHEADIRSMELPTDLVITKEVDPLQPTVGQPIEYTLTFWAESGPARGVIITDIIPSDISSVSVVSSGVTITDTGASPGYVWQVQDLLPGQVGTITISGVADVARFVNTAVITTTETTELYPANNLATVQTHVPGLIYVDQASASPTPDGHSWVTAYTSLQDALDDAAAGDQIWVAGGEYKPQNVASRLATFELVEGVEIYGGFAGGETWRHERDWVAHPTVLSGDIGTVGNNSDNAYHVLTGSGIPAVTVLDGFVITGGNADGVGADSQGGGLYLTGGSPRLANLIFAGNSAGQGAGLCNTDSSDPHLVDVAFSGNTASGFGGAVYNATNSNPSLASITFSLNSAGVQGGALYSDDTSGATMGNSVLWRNSAPADPQIFGEPGSTIAVSYSDVEDSWPGPGNLDGDPMFYDADGPDDTPGTLDDDLRLRHMSPVIDVGDNSLLPADAHDLDGDGDTSEPLPLDLSGRTRLIGFRTITPHVDMGAYEASILDVIAEADALLAQGTSFRLQELQILPADTMAQALQNYQDFNDGALFYDFCSDYGSIDSDGHCPFDRDRKNVRNGLLDAIELYLVARNWPAEDWTTHDGQVIQVWDTGGSGAVTSAREIANVHLVFGNEFLVDALDYRFSIEGIPYADEIIDKELEELGLARQQFELTVDLLFRLLDQNEWDVSQSFSSDDFESFGVASNRMITALDEMASRYFMRGDSQAALEAYDRGYEEQYMQVTALADMARVVGADYLANGSWEMFNSLSQMRDRAEAIRAGLDFFGFAPDYVPLQSYDDLLVLTEGPTGDTGLLGTARDLEDQAREAQRTFDKNATDMATELKKLTASYNGKLFDLCGASEDADGDGLDDYDPCEGGLIQRNEIDLYAASLRMGKAFQRAQNLAQRIQIEQERAAEVIQVDLGLAQEVSAIDLAIGKLNAYKETYSVFGSAEFKVYAGVKVYAGGYIQGEAIASSIPNKSGTEAKAGFKAGVDAYGGFELSAKVVGSAGKTWTPNAAEIGHQQSMKTLKAAEAKATITGANSAATIKNLLLQQSEALLEYEIALEGFNKLAAEHNHLAQKHAKYLNKRAQARDKVAQFNSHLLSPAYRIMRDTLTVQSAEAHALATQFAYLTAKAAEYELLTPYPGLNRIYRARTSNDIRLFLDDLNVWYQALDRPGQLNRYPYTLSLARDIMGLTDEYFDPMGKKTDQEIEKLRFDEFQTLLHSQPYSGTLEYGFTTSLQQQRPGGQNLFSPNIWNNRIAGIGTPLAQNEGISLNIVTRQTGDVGIPEVVLVHDGQTSYRDAGNALVNLDPGTAVPVGYVLPTELDPQNTTVALRPGINGQGAIANSGLVNLSVAAQAWMLRFPLDSLGSLDLTQIEDIEIRLDTTGRALPGRAQQAEQDALRLQAGLELEPVLDPPAPGLALGWMGESTAPAALQLLPADPTGIGGSYFGRVMVTSPLTVAVHILNFDVENLGGVLSGTINVKGAALYHEPIRLHGTTHGDAFTLVSDVISNTVLGRPVQRQFTLEGQIIDGGDVLRASYTSTVSDLLPDPVVERGRFNASRPSAPGGDRLIVEAASQLVAPRGSTLITASLFDADMEPKTDAQRITFSTDHGSVKPKGVDSSGGVAETTFTAPAQEGQALVFATTGEVTGTVRIEIRGDALPPPVTDWQLYLPAVTNAADQMLYDDFEVAAYNDAYNPTLWARTGHPDYDIRQWAGSLLFGSATAPGNSGADLYLSQPQNRNLSEIQEFEAKLKFSAGHASGYASVKMQISMDHGGGQGWWTQCTLAAQDSLAPALLCDVSTYDGAGRTTEYLTPVVAAAFDTWYTARIEADPNTAELSFYLDDVLIGSHMPSNAMALLVATNLHPKVGVWNGDVGTTATRYVDQVRITPAIR